MVWFSASSAFWLELDAAAAVGSVSRLVDRTFFGLGTENVRVVPSLWLASQLCAHPWGPPLLSHALQSTRRHLTEDSGHTCLPGIRALVVPACRVRAGQGSPGEAAAHVADCTSHAVGTLDKHLHWEHGSRAPVCNGHRDGCL